jgi:beta-N-acetylhexosaminidase
MFRKSLLLIAIIVACRASAPKIPDAPASIAGRITNVQQSGERIGTVRVEAQPGDTAGSAKAVVRITQGTTVIRAPAPGTAEFTALRAGQWVRVWFVGPVLQSYPVQANAGTIVIDSTGVPR